VWFGGFGCLMGGLVFVVATEGFNLGFRGGGGVGGGGFLGVWWGWMVIGGAQL